MERAEEIDRTMQASFDRVERAVRYRRWILDLLRPHLGRRVLEVGAGIGNITAELIRDRERVIALDSKGAYLEKLRARLIDSAAAAARLDTLAMGLEDERLARALAGENLDSAVLLNVLEHIEDDVGALRNLGTALGAGATVVVQVPAHEWLYGEADRALGHVRRYSVGQLRKSLERAGLVPRRLWQFNLLGVPGWLVSGRIRRETMFSRRQLVVYEHLVPLMRALEPRAGVPLGLSFMAVAQTSSKGG